MRLQHASKRKTKRERKREQKCTASTFQKKQVFENIGEKLALKKRHVTFQIPANKTEAESFGPDGTQQCIHTKLHIFIQQFRYHKVNLTGKKWCTWNIPYKMQCCGLLSETTNGHK